MPKTTIQIEDPFAEPPKPAGRFALFNYGFRPFFLLAGVFGALSVPVWVGLFAGHLDYPLHAPPSVWHGHEMIFGFTTAALAGFFLTVVPNWTKVKAQKGLILMVLSALWLVGRLAYWGQAQLPYAWVAVLDLLFLAMLLAVVIRPLIDPQHRRQFVFVPILVVALAGNLLTHLGVLGYEVFGLDLAQQGLMLGVDAMLVLITVMGGRVTPSFTSSYLGHANPGVKVRQNPSVDRAVLWLTWGVLVVDQVLVQSPWAGGLTVVAAVAHMVRFAGWQGWRTLGNPILWVLHLGYVWLMASLIFMALADFGLIRMSDALHAFAIGAIGTFTLGIMTRASLGHTGRAVRAAPLTVLAYILVTLAGVLRVGVMVFETHTLELVMASGVAWSLAFVCFLVVYVPILIRPRIDGRPG
ncbi:NnrS family protein [Magnetovibrio sp. PR-2]|uniref:NnrS family protein n=1 Tax=Magnetovibrio sp. PR-2 TaxID=3120356 RepID=UPI002FCE1907